MAKQKSISMVKEWKYQKASSQEWSQAQFHKTKGTILEINMTKFHKVMLIARTNLVFLVILTLD